MKLWTTNDVERKQKPSPELKLVQAVLFKGLQDACAVGGNVDSQMIHLKQEVIDEALEWVFSGESENYPFSFFWCCDQMGIDAGLILDRIKNDRTDFAEKILRQGRAVWRNSVRPKATCPNVVAGTPLAGQSATS